MTIIFTIQFQLTLSLEEMKLSANSSYLEKNR